MRLVLSFALLASCAPDADQILSKPDVGEHLSLLLAVKADGQDPTIHAIDLTPGWRIETRFDPGRPFEVFALLYRCSLVAYGIPAGQQTIGPNEGELEMPEADRLLHARINESAEQSPWTELSTPDWLRAIRLAKQRTLCADFDAEEVIIPGPRPTSPRVLLHLPGTDRVVVGMKDRRFYEVTESGWQASSALATSTSSSPADGFVEADGTIWLLDRVGCLYRGRIDQRPERVSCSPVRKSHSMGWLAGPGADEPFELFMVAEERTFERFDGTDWTVLFNNERQIPPSSKADLVWLGPGQAFAAGPAFDRVLFTNDGDLKVEDIGTFSPDEIISLTANARGTVFAGTNFGYIFRRDQTGETIRWRELAHPVNDNLLSMVPLRDGVFAAGDHGYFTHIPENGNACPTIQYIPNAAKRVIVVDDRIVVTTQVPDSDPIVVFLRRSDPAGTCYR